MHPCFQLTYFGVMFDILLIDTTEHADHVRSIDPKMFYVSFDHLEL